MATNLNIRGVISGSYGRKEIELLIQNTGEAGHQVPPTSFTSGVDVTLQIPQGAVGVILKPAANNTNPWRIKGAGGDTGVLQHPTKPTIICADTTGGPVNVIVRATAGDVLMEVIGL